MEKTRSMRANLLMAAALTTTVGSSDASATALGGIFFTDRFGYTGTVVRYGTESDARNGINVLDTVIIGDDGIANNAHEHRDVRLSFAHNATAVDRNIMLGSWWYTTTGPNQGSGNIQGNAGVGFMQLFDSNGNTDSAVSMGFSNFNGTHWTEYTLSVQGANALPGSDVARFSVYGNASDFGTYLEYDLNVTATGLEGVQTGNVIEANNHPTGVNGTFEALFWDSVGGNAGYYTIDLTFDMSNWAYDNRNSLVAPGPRFANSRFLALVPEPLTMTLLGLGLAGLVVGHRRKIS